ncbi:hypothetical protein BGZ99_006938 [Dissophora globulifera]|uniref:Uncharacterized protein n=1 Tax=Dissophora globulifera TaxID=979702 RepID=A0A9P6UQH0_9FUNG|nr:hypothetical protein BGZ99_006938 [Dissophora globulifera]
MAATTADQKNNSSIAVFAADMHIAHMDDPSKPLAPTMNFKNKHWELVRNPMNPLTGDPKIANLVAVTWLDVSAVFNKSVGWPDSAENKSAKYTIQWRLNFVGAEPDQVAIGTEFKAVIFKKNEDPLSNAVAGTRTAAISFKPKDIQDLMQHTDRPHTVPGRPSNLREAMALQETPGYDANAQGFFTLTLPGELQLDSEDLGGVIVQIQNHSNKSKRGLQIESVHLVCAA